MADEPQKLTQATFDRLTAELEDLTTRGRIEVADAIEAARALGDLKENGDYHAAQDTQGKMEARVRQLQALLKDAVIVEGDAAAEGIVTEGVVVAIRYHGDADDDVTEFFFGSIEERIGDLPVLSPTSPMGEALAGKAPGHTATFTAPGGALTVVVVEVRA